tara:strand:+ start:1311 stop:1523 length:213 start_codon:yes stop_codon:yes gene_type:complete
MSKIECKVCGATGDIRECIAGHKETDTVMKARMFEDLLEDLRDNAPHSEEIREILFNFGLRNSSSEEKDK